MGQKKGHWMQVSRLVYDAEFDQAASTVVANLAKQLSM